MTEIEKLKFDLAVSKRSTEIIAKLTNNRLNEQNRTIADLIASRDYWKQRALEAEKQHNT